MNDSSGSPTAIRLLILSKSRDQTEQFSTSLRNGGLAVHSTRLPHTEEIEEHLKRDEFDIILCCAYEKQIDSKPVQNALDDLDKDIPLLIVTDENADPEELIQAMREGARDLIDRHDLEHMQLVVAREFNALQQRRELIQLKRRLQESEMRSMGLIESSQEPIAFVQDGMHIHVNQAYVEFFGFEEPSDIQDLPLLDMIHKDKRKSFREGLKKLDADPNRRAYNLETSINLQDSGTCDATLHLAKANMDGEPCLQVMIRTNRPDPREIELKLEESKQPDQGTELPNRQFFLTQLDHWLDASVDDDSEIRAVACLGIDHMPKLRSKLGQARADELLHKFTQVMQKELQQQDLLARFNDATFTLLLRRSQQAELISVAEALCSCIASSEIPDADPSMGPSCSIGVVLIESAQTEPQDLVNLAYQASESARKLGGNQVFIPQEVESAPEINAQDSRILGQIENALAHNRFRLVFQPIVSLQGDTRENYSVLVRMLADDDEELLPEFFIKQAEQYGKMVEIDRWIIRESISQLSEQRKEGRKVNFFISLAESTLKDKGTLLWICDCLREFNARGGWLTFQIREKHSREHVKAVRKLVEGLKKIKCQIALDHFGLQQQPELSFEHLKVDFAKLAPSFVRELNNNQQKQDELNDLNAQIHKHGVKTIATGVEDANSLTVLWTVGVGYIQGYFLQEPSETIEYGSQPIV